MASYRVTVHGIPDRDSADKLASAFRKLATGSAWAGEHGGRVTVEPDDVETAEHEYGYTPTIDPRNGGRNER